MTSEKVKFNRIRKRTLNGILKEIPNSGFNENMLIKSGQKLGLEKGVIDRIFPEGLEEIKEYFFEEIDKKMIKILSKNNIEELRIRDRIATALICRFELFQKHKKSVIHIFSTDFSNPLKSMSKLWATSDIIWKIAGDQSTDFNHYTKRILLSWVYLTTFACWVKDKDKTFQETRSFLNRRIDEVLLFGKGSGKLKEKFSNLQFTEKILDLIKKLKTTKA